MKKLIFCLLIFISIILIYHNSYAFTDFSQVNYNYLNNLTDEELQLFLRDFITYTSAYNMPYIYLCKNSSYYWIYTSLTPLVVRDYNSSLVGSYEPVTSYQYYNLNQNYIQYRSWRISTSISLRNDTISQSYTIDNNSVQINNISSVVILYSNYDIINQNDNSLYFAKNFDLIQEGESEGSSVDMTETNTILIDNFGLIKAFLFLICMYLLCKAVYGVIWWLYNKTLL